VGRTQQQQHDVKGGWELAAALAALAAAAAAAVGTEFTAIRKASPGRRVQMFKRQTYKILLIRILYCIDRWN